MQRISGRYGIDRPIATVYLIWGRIIRWRCRGVAKRHFQLNKLDSIISLKEEQQTALKAFVEKKCVFSALCSAASPILLLWLVEGLSNWVQRPFGLRLLVMWRSRPISVSNSSGDACLPFYMEENQCHNVLDSNYELCIWNCEVTLCVCLVYEKCYINKVALPWHNSLFPVV